MIRYFFFFLSHQMSNTSRTMNRTKIFGFYWTMATRRKRRALYHAHTDWLSVKIKQNDGYMPICTSKKKKRKFPSWKFVHFVKIKRKTFFFFIKNERKTSKSHDAPEIRIFSFNHVIERKMKEMGRQKKMKNSFE